MQLDGDNYVLNGTKNWITNGPQADSKFGIHVRMFVYVYKLTYTDIGSPTDPRLTVSLGYMCACLCMCTNLHTQI